MNSCMHIAVVLAGGKGSRMKSSIPKQYIMLNDGPVLYYSLKAMEDSFIDAVVLVCGAQEEEYCQKELIDRYGLKKVVSVVCGGRERYDSVYNGLKEIYRLGIADNNAYVYIHDGARPCIDGELLEECRASVEKYGACVPAVPVKDTIKIVDGEGFSAGTLKRSTLMAVQTPQCFELDKIYRAYSAMSAAASDGNDISDITDDAMVAERFADVRVKLCMGSYHNIKVTTPEDITTAGELIELHE